MHSSPLSSSSACAFWMMYGNNNGTIPSMNTPDRLAYSLLRITLVDEYEYEVMLLKLVSVSRVFVFFYLWTNVAHDWEWGGGGGRVLGTIICWLGLLKSNKKTNKKHTQTNKPTNKSKLKQTQKQENVIISKGCMVLQRGAACQLASKTKGLISFFSTSVYNKNIQGVSSGVQHPGTHGPAAMDMGGVPGWAVFKLWSSFIKKKNVLSFCKFVIILQVCIVNKYGSSFLRHKRLKLCMVFFFFFFFFLRTCDPATPWWPTSCSCPSSLSQPSSASTSSSRSYPTPSRGEYDHNDGLYDNHDDGAITTIWWDHSDVMLPQRWRCFHYNNNVTISCHSYDNEDEISKITSRMLTLQTTWQWPFHIEVCNDDLENFLYRIKKYDNDCMYKTMNMMTQLWQSRLFMVTIRSWQWCEQNSN